LNFSKCKGRTKTRITLLAMLGLFLLLAGAALGRTAGSAATLSPTPPASQCVGDANGNGLGDVVDVMVTAGQPGCWVYLPLVVGNWRRPWPTTTLTPVPSPAATPTTSSGGIGHITYSLPNGRVYRIAAHAEATPEDVSLALNGLASGSEDAGLNTSPDAAWLVLSTDRFDPDCAGWPCLAIVAGDLSAGEAVRAGGALVHPEGGGAVASGGKLIVYPNTGGPHTLDLWAVTRSGIGNDWSAPQLLTGGSSYAYNDFPAISAGGSQVVFDCKDQPFPSRAICTVGADGTGFRIVLTQAGSPPGFPKTGALHHPDYAPDGSIVFEGDWGGEQIWRLPLGATEPVRVASQFGNDNSPCALPDGRLASLWLERPGGPSFHELKVMSPDGSSYIMVLTGVDVFDIGIGCGE